MGKKELKQNQSRRNVFCNLIISVAALLLMVALYLLMYMQYDIVYVLGKGFIITSGVVVSGLAANIVLCLVYLHRT